MENIKKVVLQGSWRSYKSKGGLEVGSVLKQVRFVLKGPPIEKLEALINELMLGAPKSKLNEYLSKKTGISLNDVESVLSILNKNSALIDLKQDSSEVNSLYDRQVRFFNYFEDVNSTGEEYNNRLQKSKVVIVGLGGYGTWLALLCSRIGIKTIIGIDPDTVELSNLSRQVIYEKDDVGELKIKACEKYLKKADDNIKFIGYPIKITSPEDLIPLIEGTDLVFNPFGYIPFDSEYPKYAHFIAQAAIRAGVPSLVFSGSWLGPINIPGNTPCYGCVMLDDKISKIASASLPNLSKRFLPAFAPRIVNTASLAVWEAARFLAGINISPSLSGILALDTFNYEKHSIIPVSINNECPYCSSTVFYDR